MVLAKQNQIVRLHFTVFSSDGITPLTGQAGSCTSSLRKDGATTGEAVTIAEIGTTGRYYASFTPLSTGEYDLEVTCPDNRVIGDSFEVQAYDLDDLGVNIIRSLGLMQDNAVHDDLTYTANKLTGGTIYLYDSRANAVLHDKITGLIAKYTIEGTYSGSDLSLGKVLRDL